MEATALKAPDASESDWKDGFLFLGNQTALDFLNTRPFQNGEPVELLPDFPALLRWFRAAGLLSAPDAIQLQERCEDSPRGRRIWKGALDLRERLRTELAAWERGGSLSRSAIDEINRLLAAHPMRTRLKLNGKAYSEELWFDPNQPEDLLAPLAHAAADLFANAPRDRVRKCEQCVLHFHDTSKKGTRRWCSMRLCGNRSKVAAYAARQRKRED